MSEQLMKQSWASNFGRNESLYMIDGATIRFDSEPGLLFEHGLIRDHTLVIKKCGVDWRDLPVGEAISIQLDAEDQGLISEFEVVFQTPEGQQHHRSQKTLELKVPVYSEFEVWIRLSGSGQTRLKAIKVDRVHQKGLAVFRTHVWNADIEKLYRAYAQSVGEMMQVAVFADETSGVLNLPSDIIKISHTVEDAIELGLTQIPKKVLWRNGDYALYLLRHKYDAPYYVISENDVLISGRKTFRTILDYFEQEGQLVVANYHEVDERNNYVRSTAAGIYPEEDLAKAYVWLWGASRELADQLYQARLDLPNQIEALSTWQWPADEVFLGTSIKQMGIEILNLQELADVDVSRLTYRPVYSMRDADIWLGESITHGVAPQSQIFDRYAKEADFLLKHNDWKLYEGNLYKQMMLSYLEGDNQTVYNAMIDMVYRSRRNDVKIFVEFAESQGLTYPKQINWDNLAFLKPVTLSSQWSGPAGFTPPEGFHLVDGNYDLDKYRMNGAATEAEVDPWMVIDLEKIQNFSQIKLYHREAFQERTKAIRISLSMDGKDYRELVTDDNVTFRLLPSGRNKQGCVYQADYDFEPQKARYIKLTRLGDQAEIFHLNQIEVFK
jgi:hypothetical protein